MGATPEKEEKQILVPSAFDFPPMADRARMSVPAYELMFGKLQRHGLFHDYFNQAGSIDTRILFQQLGRSKLDLTGNVSIDGGEAQIRWERHPHTFVDFLVSTSKPMRLTSCAYSPKYHIGAFGTFPLVMGSRDPEDYSVMGLRYGSENLSIGASFVPFHSSGIEPHGAWLVGRKGNLSAGIQYKPLGGSKNLMHFTDLKNWNCAISYGDGSTSPLSPSFTLALELVRSSQLVASFYLHQVSLWCGKPLPLLKYPDGANICGSSYYIDLGLELARRVDNNKPIEDIDNPLFQIAASSQPHTNLLLKGKLGPSKSSAALAFKFQPYLTCSVTVENDHSKGNRKYGLGIFLEGIREPSYQTIGVEGKVLTKHDPNLEGEKEVRQFEFVPGKYDHLPTGLKPIDKIFLVVENYAKQMKLARAARQAGVGFAGAAAVTLAGCGIQRLTRSSDQ